MTEPRFEDFSDPKDYHAARADHLAARVEELSEAEQIASRAFAESHAENQRLREALEMISALHSYGTLGDLSTYKEKVRGYARAALKETSDD